GVHCRVTPRRRRPMRGNPGSTTRGWAPFAAAPGGAPGAAAPPATRATSRRCPIGGDLDLRDLGHGNHPLEEPAGRLRVALRGDEHVDDLPELVNRAVDVAPLAGALHRPLRHLRATA